MQSEKQGSVGRGDSRRHTTVGKVLGKTGECKIRNELFKKKTVRGWKAEGGVLAKLTTATLSGKKNAKWESQASRAGLKGWRCQNRGT